MASSVDLDQQRYRLDEIKQRFRAARADQRALEQLPLDLRDSWQRCGRSVRPESVAPLDVVDPATAWTTSPIRRAGAGPIDELAALAEREDYIAAVTDPEGRIIWSSAGRQMAAIAERANFVRGADWSESAAGTNAPGLVLRTGRPAAVFATEHWCDPVVDWVCYAAPIRDPSGRVIGAVDLSAHWRKAHPLALTTITTLARLIELEIAATAATASASPKLRIAVLGQPLVTLRGTPVPLANRPLEILTLLALHDGLSLARLQELLCGDRDVSPVTIRAEVSRLRAALDNGIASRPYRLQGTVELDVAIAVDALGRGDLETALRCYRGPLLPTSDSPYLRQLGYHIDSSLGDGLLRAGTAEQLATFATRAPYGQPFLDRATAISPVAPPPPPPPPRQ